MTEAPLITCPKCNTVLDRKVIRRVEVDQCSGCGGLWLDRGELVKLKLMAGRRTIKRLAEPRELARKVPPTSDRVRLPCPVCNGVLAPLRVNEVAVDICSSCRGLFLDKGELDPVIDAMGEGLDAATLDKLIGIEDSK